MNGQVQKELTIYGTCENKTTSKTEKNLIIYSNSKTNIHVKTTVSLNKVVSKSTAKFPGGVRLCQESGHSFLGVGTPSLNNWALLFWTLRALWALFYYTPGWIACGAVVVHLSW